MATGYSPRGALKARSRVATIATTRGPTKSAATAARRGERKTTMSDAQRIDAVLVEK
jgi:hypothetical protein